MSGWLNYERIPGATPGGYVAGYPARLVLHSTEGTTIEGAVGAYRSNGWPHFTLDPYRRRAVQHLGIDVAASAMMNRPGGVETNRAAAVQIEIVGFASRRGDTPPIALGLADLPDPDADWLGARIGEICRAAGIPLVSPVAWAPYPASYGYRAAQRLTNDAWRTVSGIVGHQHVPENDHGDPGALPILRILNAAGASVPTGPIGDSEMTTLPHPWKPAQTGALPHFRIDPGQKLVHGFHGASLAHDLAVDPRTPEKWRIYPFDGRPFILPGDNPAKIVPAGSPSGLWYNRAAERVLLGLDPLDTMKIQSGAYRLIVSFSDSGTFQLALT